MPGIDDVAEFADTMNAMRVIGLSQEEQDNIFRMLSVILWLGNIQFVEDEQGNGAISDSSVTDFVAYLLEVDGPAVHKALTIRMMETGEGVEEEDRFTRCPSMWLKRQLCEMPSERLSTITYLNGL